MKLKDKNISHIQTLTHDGKILIVGTAPEGVIYYAVKRSGYEPSALADTASPLGFEPWERLRTDESVDDPSVAAYETANLTATDGAALLRSRYGIANETTRSADAPVQLLSALGHVYVFRQSPAGKVLVSRFVLDGMTNKLVPRLEVRFRRSKKRMTPDPIMTKKGNALENVDSVDYRDMNNKPFYEPATELSFLGTVANGWFAVALVPTAEVGVSRWHFVVYDSTAQKLMAYSVLASESGLFDVSDSLYGAPDPAKNGAVVYRTIAGILKRTLTLQSVIPPSATTQSVTVASGPALTTYDLQYEQVLDDGSKQLMRDATRLMLTVPVRRSGETTVNVATLTFGLAADGTLSQVDASVGTTTLLRSQVRDLMLPLDVLDQIKAFATMTPAAAGKILACERGDGDKLRIRAPDPLPSDVVQGSSVQIRGTKSYDGHYRVSAVDGNKFTVEAAFLNNEPGFWEVVPERETGLVFDNMVVGYQKTADGKLQVQCFAHDLVVGNEVQISGTRAHDGVVSVASVDAATKSIVLDTPYFTGEAANLSTVRRCGLLMNGGEDKVVTPSLGLTPSRSDRPWSRTSQVWVRVDAITATADRKLIADTGGVTSLVLDTAGKGRFDVRMADGTTKTVNDPTAVAITTWVHYAGTVSYDPAATTDKTTIKLIRNGVEVGTQAVSSSYPLSADGPTHLDGLPLAFDGTDDHVALPSLSAGYSNGITLEVWARSDSATGGGQRFFDLGTGAPGDNIIFARHATTTQIFIQSYSGTTAGTAVNSPVGTCEVGKWNHFAVTISSTGAVVLYKNGVSVGTGTTTAPTTTTVARSRCYIGKSNWSTDGLFSGAMADARIWNRVRTAAEIQADMRRRLRGNEVGLVACWPLDDGTGRELTGKYPGTLTGAPARSAAVPAADAFTLGEATIGEVADVQVWTAARAAADIKATMYLTLTGREEGLAGYYRLGGLLQGDKVTTPDLAVGQHDAEVKGAPYISAKRLNRATTSSAKVIKYANDALVAVSQRATYEETFEFKLNGGTGVTVTNADSIGGKLFSLKYWGKRGRNSDAVIQFPAGSFQQQEFVALSGGWYQVTCRFTVPSGVSMLRAFEMGEVRGRWATEATAPATEWTSIDVRKHRIRQLSGSMTREEYTSTLTLTQLAATPPSLASVLTDEAKVHVRRAEVRDLLQRLDVAKNRTRYEAEKTTLQNTTIPARNTTRTTLATEIATLRDAITSYYWQIKDPTYGMRVQPRFASTAEHAYLGIGAESSQESQQWLFEDVAGAAGTYKIRNRASSLVVELADTYVVRGTCVWLAQESGATQQKWKLTQSNTASNGEKIYSVENVVGYDWNVWGGGHAENDWIKMHPRENTWNMKFAFQRGDMLQVKADSLKDKEATLATLDAELMSLNSRVNELTALLALTETEAFVNGLLTTARTNLNTDTATLTASNTTYLTNLAALPPLTMPAVATDSRGLVTQGAVLDFARPSGRVSLAETCDGNVLLTYADSQGRLCQTAYDAAADSRNAAFDQWLPPAGRAAASFGSSGSMALASPVSLPDGGFTFETWFQYPLPFKDDGTKVSYYSLHAFASDASGQNIPLAVADGDRLGLMADGTFFDSGARLSSRLTAGWHHAAVVTRASGADFYLDGVKVGAASRSFRGFRIGNVMSSMDVPTFAWPTNNFTLSVWARSAIATWNGPPGTRSHAGLSNLMTKQGSCSLTITTGTRDLKWWIYTTQVNEVSFTPDDIQGWHMYTGTCDGTTMCLYVDGKLVRSVALVAGSTVSNSGITMIGYMANGDVAEPCMWNRALSALEIEDLLRSTPKDDDTSLIGAWTAGEGATVTTLRDRSGQKRDATCANPLMTVEMKPVCTGALTVIGNNAAGLAPAGRIAEVRLWEGALTDDEIAANARSVLTGNEPGLLHYWPLSEGTGTTARDLAADGQVHGTVATPPWIACTLPLGGALTRALAFDGRSAYVDVPSDKLPVSSNLLTLACYVRCTGGRGRKRTVVSFRGFCLTMESTDRWSAQIRTTSGENGVLATAPATSPAMGEWVHLAATYNGTTITLYVNGASVSTGTGVYSASTGVPLRIGAGGASSPPSDCLAGEVAMVSVFKKAVAAADIASLMKPLQGTDLDLIGYWPLDEAYKANLTARDLGPSNLTATVTKAAPLTTYDLPMNKGAEATFGEYSTVAPAPGGGNQAVMRRFFALASGGDVEVVPELRVEELTLQWIGNMQLNPTLLGYIEGPPPVPSENLTVDKEEGYLGATSVTLRQSEDITYSWNRSEDGAASFDMSGFIGAGWEAEAGVMVMNRLTEGEVGAAFNYSHSATTSHQSSVSAASSLQMSDTLSLRGAREQTPRFPRLGARYVPKNVGYALVVSGLADIFITKLRRTGRMVSYDIRPVEGIPLDINTITFMINPAYTMNGSLDGLVGSSAADERFYGHVPDLRAQFGALYPASYYRLKEAYDLKHAIEQKDKDRETYFANYDVSSKEFLNIKEAATVETAAPSAPSGLGGGGDEKDPAKAEAQRKELSANAEAQKKELSAEAQKKKDEITSKYSSLDARVRASGAFDDWQKRMERLQIQAGKRNIVNTYVWDGDGGLRAESESFASTIEHSIGSGTSDAGGAGAESDVLVANFKSKLSLMGNGASSSQQTKTMSTTKAVELEVDLEGVESTGITDLSDRPLMPGEKVDRYRFMTFFLEGTVDHFHDFFNLVVDPEWLISNDEEARALRQTQAARPNACWRVLHRVTYVERPSLMGFGSK